MRDEVLGWSFGMRKRDHVEERLSERKKAMVGRLNGQEYEAGKAELRDMVQRGALKPRMSY